MYIEILYPHIVANMSNNSENVCKCGKKYKHRSRLLSHQSTCKEIIQNQPQTARKITAKNTNESSYERLMNILKQNDELTQQLKNVSERFNNMNNSNGEIKNNVTTTTTTTTTDTVRNQEFDINVYLNANFKDKKHFTDLIDRIEIVRGYKSETKKITHDDGREEIFQFENSLYSDPQSEEGSNSA